MKKKIAGKVCAAALAAVCAFNMPFISSVAGAAESKYEFEDGTLSGAVIPDSSSERWRDGASGGKFVFLEKGGETASVNVNVETTGMYTVKIGYSAPYGDKIHNLYVNGVDQGQVSFAETAEGVWSEVNCGSVKLNAGDNVITVKSSWGWTNLDYITIEEASLPEIKATDTSCCDPKATPEANYLMSYLSSVYGSHILSGQQEIYAYGPHDFEYEFNYIKDKTGELPAIRGFDFLNSANILYGNEDGTADRMIDWVNNKNGIVTASWHVTVPKDFTSFVIGQTSVDWSSATYKPDETDFDTSKVLENGTKENEYYMLCLEALATQLKKLQDANVPVIFRPLHEAEGSGGEEGSWFWWGKSGSAVYKDLWILTYETLTEKYDLHNIIWEWNSYNYETSANWYPGDEYVDIVAYDKYNCTDWSTGSPVLTHNDSAISSTFYGIMEKYNSKKMVAMAENDSIPTLENLLAEKAGWLYFCPWYDGKEENEKFLTNPVFNVLDDLIEIYQSDYCITLDELPEDLYKTTASKPSEDPTEPATDPTEPSETPTEPSTDPTEAPTDAPTDEPTDAPTDPTEPASSEPTTESTDPTEPATDPTEPDSKIPVPEGVTASKYGDVDVNGEISIADVVTLNKLLLNADTTKVSDIGMANADCEKDGYLTMSDSAKIINCLAKIIGENDLGN
ncbi:MAG: glycosyl hydrolase [Porcipelethomonas sp.]